VPDQYDLDIDFLNAAGDGVARLGGRQHAIPFTIPGERVRISVGRRGELTGLEILRPSPHRVVPGCAHFGPDAEPGVGPCGGCAWQHIAYAEQLRLKTALVERLLREFVPSRTRLPTVLPTLAGIDGDEPWGYRHKVHFVFGNTAPRGRRQGQLQMGHYVRGSRRLVPVRECPVHAERGNRVAFEFYDAYFRAGLTAADPQDARGSLRGVTIRVAAHTPEVMATLVVAGESDKRLRTATRRAASGPFAPDSLHVNIHPEDDGFIFGRQTRRITGPERLREEVAGTTFLISPTAFFQTNVHAAGHLVRLVTDAVAGLDDIVDLYAGAGLFALPLASAGHTVTAVEENRTAVEDGIASARFNRIPMERCRFVAKPVETALARVHTASAVILDPPRGGCAQAVLEAVFERIRPTRAVYVSCSPEALARDLAYIAETGYAIDSVQPVDMFPHTAHVETVVVLTRRPPPA